MTQAHRDGLKVGAIGGAITALVGIVVIILGLGAWGERKADKVEVKRIELMVLSNDKRITLLEQRAEDAADVNSELLELLRERRHSGGQR